MRSSNVAPSAVASPSLAENRYHTPKVRVGLAALFLLIAVSACPAAEAKTSFVHRITHEGKTIHAVTDQRV